MSERLEPEPSCSKEQSKSYYGKYVRSSRILNKNSHDSFCLRCSANAEICSDRYELVITHHLTNDLLYQYICVSCNKRLSHARLSLKCSLCSRKYTELYFKFREQSIDMNQSIFRIDLFSDTLEDSILSI